MFINYQKCMFESINSQNKNKNIKTYYYFYFSHNRGTKYTYTGKHKSMKKGK